MWQSVEPRSLRRPIRFIVTAWYLSLFNFSFSGFWSSIVWSISPVCRRPVAASSLFMKSYSFVGSTVLKGTCHRRDKNIGNWKNTDVFRSLPTTVCINFSSQERTCLGPSAQINRRGKTRPGIDSNLCPLPKGGLLSYVPRITVGFDFWARGHSWFLRTEVAGRVRTSAVAE